MVLNVKVSVVQAKWGPLVFTCFFLLKRTTLTSLKLSLISWVKALVIGLESRLIRGMADQIKKHNDTKSSSGANSVDWFEGAESNQVITSAATNSEDRGILDYNGPNIYQESHELSLPYPKIADTTEGIAAFENLYNLGVFQNCTGLVLNLGGGAYDDGPQWLEKRVPGVKVLTADPFCRSKEHNRSVQDIVEGSLAGVEIVMSISVLNVIQKRETRLLHITLAHNVLKHDGGVFYAKVWAGYWPRRGTGASQVDSARDSYQSNRWAIDYLAEVEAVFGPKNCFLDCQNNMIVAVKKPPIDIEEVSLSLRV